MSTESEGMEHGLNIAGLFMQMQSEMTKGFTTITERLDSKASKHDLDALGAKMQEGFEQHDGRLNALEAMNVAEQAELRVAREHHDEQTTISRWRTTVVTVFAGLALTTVAIVLGYIH